MRVGNMENKEILHGYRGRRSLGTKGVQIRNKKDWDQGHDSNDGYNKVNKFSKNIDLFSILLYIYYLKIISKLRSNLYLKVYFERP